MGFISLSSWLWAWHVIWLRVFFWEDHGITGDQQQYYTQTHLGLFSCHMHWVALMSMKTVYTVYMFHPLHPMLMLPSAALCCVYRTSRGSDPILTGRSTLTSVPSSRDTRQVMIDFASPAAGMCVEARWASRNRVFSACFRMERRPSVLRRKLSMMRDNVGYKTTPEREKGWCSNIFFFTF